MPTAPDSETPAARLERLYPLLIHLAKQRGGDDWEDLVQETAVAILRNRWPYDAVRGSDATWLWWLVRQAAERLARYRRKRAVTVTRFADGYDPPARPAVEEDDQVRAAVAALPDPQRRVVELKYGLADGVPRTFEQVGEHLGYTRQRAFQVWSEAELRLAVMLAG